MNLEHYNIEVNRDFLEYNFYSQGSMGLIKKIVRFSKVKLGQLEYYNLGFGDWNEKEKRIDDLVISNNQDSEKVLATVAATVIDFTGRNPNVVIYAEGSSLSRTRRYQIGLNKYWTEIEKIFDVFGLIENEGFERFIKGKNYKAFVVRRKIE